MTYTTFIPTVPLQHSSLTSRRCCTARPVHLTPRRRTRPRLSPLPILASTQQEIPWNPVKIVDNVPACEAHRLITINVGTTLEKGSLADTYRTPGQYIQLRDDQSTKPSFLSISSPPNIQGIFEFLIKEAPSVDWLTATTPGAAVEMSPVQGKGFPIYKLDEAPQSSHLLLFATGSGIAPIRALIESPLNGLNAPKRSSVKLFYGCRYPQRMAYRERFEAWQKLGVEVIPVMSQPQLGEDEWHGKTGYVQHVLKDVGVPFPEHTAAVLCGVRGMTQDVEKFLVDVGVPQDRILFNF